jgi:hypothetical protein
VAEINWPERPEEPTPEKIDKRAKRILDLAGLFADAKDESAQLAIFEEIKKDLPADDREKFARDLGAALDSLATNFLCMRLALFEVFSISEKDEGT